MVLPWGRHEEEEKRLPEKIHLETWLLWLHKCRRLGRTCCRTWILFFRVTFLVLTASSCHTLKTYKITVCEINFYALHSFVSSLHDSNDHPQPQSCAPNFQLLKSIKHVEVELKYQTWKSSIQIARVFEFIEMEFHLSYCLMYHPSICIICNVVKQNQGGIKYRPYLYTSPFLLSSPIPESEMQSKACLRAIKLITCISCLLSCQSSTNVP